MLVVATFENSIHLELSLSILTKNGIPQHQIFGIPLDKRTEPRQLFDSIHHADGFSMLDLAAILGTCLMLLGGIYGFVWKWGPIIWSIIGCVTGMLAGFFIKFLLIKKNGTAGKKISSEVILLVRCKDEEAKMVESLLWDNLALGIAKIKDA